jgi:hypothetical protein
MPYHSMTNEGEGGEGECLELGPLVYYTDRGASK